MSPTAALSGSLADLPLADLFGLLTATGQSGVVEFSGAVAAVIVIDAGSLTLGLVDGAPTLQQVVIGSATASADQWEAAQVAVRSGAGLADALIEQGCDPDRLRDVLAEQVVGTVFELLLAPDDTFAFLPGAGHPLGTRFPFDAPPVLDEARGRVEAWRVIAEAIPSTDAVLRLRRELPSPTISLVAEDWRVLSLVDGHATVAGIIRELGMSAFAVCAVLHRLIDAGAVEHATP
jgi:hypothetical protein